MRPARQIAAASQRAYAEEQLAKTMKKLGRLVTSIKFWQRKVAYYSKRERMTDAEYAKLIEKKARPKPTRVPRGIQL